MNTKACFTNIIEVMDSVMKTPTIQIVKVEDSIDQTI